MISNELEKNITDFPNKYLKIIKDMELLMMSQRGSNWEQTRNLYVRFGLEPLTGKFKHEVRYLNDKVFELVYNIDHNNFGHITSIESQLYKKGKWETELYLQARWLFIVSLVKNLNSTFIVALLGLITLIMPLIAFVTPYLKESIRFLIDLLSLVCF